jgi:recombinational DNA repair ATPase RecF
MIIFKRIRFKNFLSYGNVFTEIQLDKTHTTVLVGESGSGKSSITDAIVFALYGKPFRNINKPQLVNTINKSDCVVEIEFSIGSSEYKIVRGIKPNIFEIWSVLSNPNYVRSGAVAFMILSIYNMAPADLRHISKLKLTAWQQNFPFRLHIYPELQFLQRKIHQPRQ